eukprot:scaffold62591_cov58-Phaeocystis_antarctica.AAC.2
MMSGRVFREGRARGAVSARTRRRARRRKTPAPGGRPPWPTQAAQFPDVCICLFTLPPVSRRLPTATATDPPTPNYITVCARRSDYALPT